MATSSLELSAADKIRRTAFLGREFLTWLLYRSTRDEGIFRLGETVVEVFFERVVDLDGENPQRQYTALKDDSPGESEETMLALRLGKKVSKARLLIILGGREFGVTLDSGLHGLRAVKLPEGQALDPIEAMSEEQDQAAELEGVVYGLLEQFLRLRVSAQWGAETRRIAHWIAGTSGPADVVDAMQDALAAQASPLAKALRPRPGSGIDSVSIEHAGRKVTMHADGKVEDTGR